MHFGFPLTTFNGKIWRPSLMAAVVVCFTLFLIAAFRPREFTTVATYRVANRFFSVGRH